MGIIEVLGLTSQVVAGLESALPGHGVQLAAVLDEVATSGFYVGVAVALFSVLLFVRIRELAHRFLRWS